MELDIDTIGYFLYMEEQDKNRYTEEDLNQEQEEKEG